MQRKKTMALLNFAYAPKCDSNLISLGQLHESRILYHDQSDFIIFTKEGSILKVANRHKNLFVLETSSKVILVKKIS